ncbi:hypothetical protein F3Y22_tig00111582pilonHSYRG01032 [Hibiscus syriacus]|uniref:Uncharacterized protein n=1 Tax=Hibiscus syriacus TaxID=106335 RepID=A0A6A2XKH7_HIBSY|nr:hypothetical protein F3Y22_tig00111582pilonHSYRG01032 [Hibiscus syriacus]
MNGTASAQSSEKASGKVDEIQTLFVQNIPPRFSKKEDTERAMQRLNGFWLFGYRLSVKEARFRAKNSSGDLNSPSNSNTAIRVPNDKSIAEEVSETQTRRRSRSIQGVIDDEVVRKLQKCLVGTMATVCSSTQVVDRLRAGGLGEVRIKFMGGRDFLLEFMDEELYTFMKEHNWSFLREVFLEVNPWTESYRASERVTWIKLIGVPLHCWNHNTFKRISELWGECLAMGENALQESSCEEMTILIATRRKELIDEVVDLEAGRDVFKIRVVEQNTSRSDTCSHKKEAKVNLVTDDSSASTVRSMEPTEEEKAERWHEEDDSYLMCMGNIPRGGCMSGREEVERNIGEDAIVGQRVNDVCSGKSQKQYEVEEGNEVEVAEDDCRFLVKVVDDNEGINENLKDLSIREGGLGAKAVEVSEYLGLTNSFSKKGSNKEQLDGCLADPKVNKSSLRREGEEWEKGLCLQMSDDIFIPKTKQNFRAKEGKIKKYSSIKKIQGKYGVTQGKIRNCRVKKIHRKELSEEELTELEGRSLSDSDLQERWQRKKSEARKTLQIGRELGIQFKGSEEALVKEIAAGDDLEGESQSLSIDF